MSSKSLNALIASIPPQLRVPNVSILTSSVARVVGMNPHAMTLGGSNTYLVGKKGVFDVKNSFPSTSLQLADDSPLKMNGGVLGSSAAATTTSNSSARTSPSTPLVMLVDSGEGKPIYPSLINYVMASQQNGDASAPRLGSIFLTHWHGDHVGGVCDALVDVANTLMLVEPTSVAVATTAASTSTSITLPFAIFKKDGLVMPNKHLHQLLSKQLALKIQRRVALIDGLLGRIASLEGGEQQVVLFDLCKSGNCSTANSFREEELWQFASKHYFYRKSVWGLNNSNSTCTATINFIDGIPSYLLSDDTSALSQVIPLSISSLMNEKRYLSTLTVPFIIDPSDLSFHASINGMPASAAATATALSLSIGCGSNDSLIKADTEVITYTKVPVTSDTTATNCNSTVCQLGNFHFAPDGTMSVLTSPGHTDDHTVLYNKSEGTLITADTVLGAFAALPTPQNPNPAPITTAFTCYSDYMQTLEDLSSRSSVEVATDGTAAVTANNKKPAVKASTSASSPLAIDYILPGHGGVIPEFSEKRVDYYITHRVKRESQVVACLKVQKDESMKKMADPLNYTRTCARSPSLAKATVSPATELASNIGYNPCTAAGLVDTIYQGVIPAGSNLVTAAQGNVLHILRKLLLKNVIVVTGPSSVTAAIVSNTDTGDALVQTFLAEEAYPRQLYTLPDTPSEEVLLRDVYASLGGSGESPPPVVDGGSPGASEQKTAAQRYSTELFWHLV